MLNFDLKKCSHFSYQFSIIPDALEKRNPKKLFQDEHLDQSEGKEMAMGCWACFHCTHLLPHHEITFCSSPSIPQAPPELGDRLPKISFPNSLSPEENKYLGWSEEKLSLDDIKTKLILVDFIGINCHFCIQSIPTMNEIYKTIEKDST